MKPFISSLFSVVLLLAGCSESTNPNELYPQPVCATNPQPANGTINVSIADSLGWTYTHDPEYTLPIGFRLLLAENEDLSGAFEEFIPFLVEGSYRIPCPIELNYINLYYWQVIPTTEENQRDEAIACEIWHFRTEPDSFSIVTDIDGNVYQTMIFGDQEWMAENLRVTHYRNGEPISHVTDNYSWETLSSEAYCVYGNMPELAVTYGNLYNWYAVTDARGLAPEGWHIPSDQEIMELEMFLGMNYGDAHGSEWRGTNQGSRLSGAAELWMNGILETDPEFGSSGFDFIPGGHRVYNSGHFAGIGNTGYLWSSTNTYNNAKYRSIQYNHSEIWRSNINLSYGFSVRCVRDR